MKQQLKNVRLFEGEEMVERHITIENGVIASVHTELQEVEETIDCEGLLLSPGFVDVHIHLREPGATNKETIATGTQAAARGGFTTVCAMPNTRPVPDNEENMQLVLDLIKENAVVNVLPYASITERQIGKQLTPMDRLQQMGAVAFTDDGVGVQTASVMYEAMEQAASLNASIVAHCEDNSLIYGGAMHKGKVSENLGIPGIPNVCESVQIARDVLLAEATGCHYHVCHVSTKESVRVIRDAKAAGIPVTAEVTPHHLLLTEEDIVENDAMYKMNPPLRSKEDREALCQGLLDGTIDCIATDHAPHTEEEKQQPMEGAPFGIVGLETAFSLLHTHLVKTGFCSLKQLLDWLTIKPASVFGINAGEIKVGGKADLVLLDVTKQAEINRHAFVSKGKNTPFHSWNVIGAPKWTMVAGEIVWEGDGQHGKA
ncbi:dihydroorotase [Pontibacillus litoralis]|uniref:Dihydroorotase n=1 Tax=Pontibacillus litoralis JSM 072002 TaxID=1385512 RepID=A0A0A5G5Y9_9BACI|nr:dihydroorotase [Pontibacillus litoralis]KGX88516.1 dihydroorotase [Pontibacillus litoralis JSM 072002]